MNEIINKFLLEGDKFMPEMHLKQPGFFIVLAVNLPKINKESKNLCKLEIQILFIELNLIKLVLNMIRLMENLQIS